LCKKIKFHLECTEKIEPTYQSSFCPECARSTFCPERDRSIKHKEVCYWDKNSKQWRVTQICLEYYPSFIKAIQISIGCSIFQEEEKKTAADYIDN